MRNYGYVGVPGAYGEEALLTQFEGTVKTTALTSLPLLLRAIETGEIDGGVCPVENASTGPIHDVVTLLETTELNREKLWLSVQHCLLALPGQTVHDIGQVISDPQTLAECAGRLRELGVEVLSMFDAAASAAYIFEQQLTGVAAVASARAAALYHLEVLAQSIQQDARNLTRYVLLHRGPVLHPSAAIIAPRRTVQLVPTVHGLRTGLSQPGRCVAEVGNGWRPAQTASLAVVAPPVETLHPAPLGRTGTRESAALSVLAAGEEEQVLLWNLPAHQVSPIATETKQITSAPTESAIALKDVCKTYGKGKQQKLAVDHLTMEVQRGEIFGLLGPNGSGKTTTINLLCGLLQPTAGSIHLLGRAVSIPREMRHIRQRLGVVSQETALYGELTGQANLAFQAGLYGMSRRQEQRRIHEVLTLVDLVAVKDKRVSAYSGGMKRRLAIARALLPDPEILILDEPTLGVDVHSKHAIWSHIRALREQGKTVLLTTNTLDEAQALADRLAILDHGRLLVLDTLDHLTAQYGDGVLEVETTKVSRQVERLQAVPGVTEVVQDGVSLRLRAQGMNDQLTASVLTILAEEGAVTSFRVSKPTLDEIFLQLTGVALRD